ncbi:phosphotransferase enzyme family protein [Synechococcus sp. HK01-R]|uniref:phosphotransferase enzyme family protein n=1 Tax=Synechococcus sp. HK01-R TaxID=2751171 RepID=UPI001623AD6F|nr:aminoglycoside phosphotransferase family protein [Synechococcus sp. HK01-R]QNG26459.1 aminoglycoside phosphotransferase family protein [Synechococcus sp. HK01-R]
MAEGALHHESSLQQIAGQFHPPERIAGIQSLGSGNVNDTFLVRLDGEGDPPAFVMQRLNTTVFARPELVMGNLLTLGRHVQRRLASPPPELAGRRWEVPRVLAARGEAGHWVEHDGQFWRSITYIGAATTTDVIRDASHAREIGYGLGMFHHLISDLPAGELADTLEGFHVTPAYLSRYDAVLSCCSVDGASEPRLQQALEHVERRRVGVDVLEAACARGELQRRPIHGDPKINNVMIDESNGQAVGLIDLDTVKPGLIHYDIGDCLRSCCNAAGEETLDLASVRFDLSLCRSILDGYLAIGRSFLTDADLRYLPDCIRLIPFELGLRFLTDHLEGDIYFRTERPEHNLDRALVQFALTESIESQWDAISDLVQASISACPVRS